MTTDKQELRDPTDEELIQFAVEEQFLLFCDEDDFVQIAREVLYKWGRKHAESEGLINKAYRQGQVDFGNRAVEVCCAQNHWEANSIANVIGDLDILHALPKDQDHE